MTLDFGVARSVDAQSFGRPGERTFRLRVLGSEAQSVWLWVEKEHLRAVSLALHQLLAQLKYRGQAGPADTSEFPEVAQHEVQVGLMGIGFDPPDRTLVLQVSEPGMGEEEEPTLRVRLTLELCSTLAAQIDEIIAGGRPECPLCGLPVDPSGHACVRSNGHSEQPIPESPQDTDS